MRNRAATLVSVVNSAAWNGLGKDRASGRPFPCLCTEPSVSTDLTGAWFSEPIGNGVSGSEDILVVCNSIHWQEVEGYGQFCCFQLSGRRIVQCVPSWFLSECGPTGKEGQHGCQNCSEQPEYFHWWFSPFGRVRTTTISNGSQLRLDAGSKMQGRVIRASGRARGFSC